MIDKSKKVFITGGAGFVGCNLAHSLLSEGYNVTVIDNLSRKGVRKNLEWLKNNFEDRFIFYEADVTDFDTI